MKFHSGSRTLNDVRLSDLLCVIWSRKCLRNTFLEGYCRSVTRIYFSQETHWYNSCTHARACVHTHTLTHIWRKLDETIKGSASQYSHQPRRVLQLNVHRTLDPLINHTSVYTPIVLLNLFSARIIQQNRTSTQSKQKSLIWRTWLVSRVNIKPLMWVNLTNGVYIFYKHFLSQ